MDVTVFLGVLCLCLGFAMFQETNTFQKCEFNKSNIFTVFTLDRKTFENSSVLIDKPVTDLWTNECTMDYTTKMLIGNDNPLIYYRNYAAFVKITSSNIKELRQDYFCYFENLLHLNLSNNHFETISQIGVGADSDCNKKCCVCRLQTLALSKNRFRTVTRNLFCQLRSVMYLDLHQCRLESIEYDAFSLLTDLRTISLNDNNLKQIDSKTFINNLMLESIELNRNNLSRMPIIGHLTNLKKLYMMRNNISALSKMDFHNCTKVSVIDLIYNSISYIELGTFSNMLNLENLFLSNNSMDSLNDSFVTSNITNIFLQSNLITEFKITHFSSFTKQIFLDKNQISTLDASHSENYSLNYLRLSRNQLTTINQLSLPKTFERLDLGSNKLTNLTFHSSYYNLVEYKQTRLKLIDLQNNKFNVVPELPYSDGSIFYNLSANPLVCSCVNAWRLWNYNIFLNLLQMPCNLMIDSTHDLNMAESANWSVNDLYCYSEKFRNHQCFRSQWRSDFIECKQGCPNLCQCLLQLNYTRVSVVCSSRKLESIPQYFDNRRFYSQSEIIAHLDGNSIKTIFSNDFIDYKNVVVLLLNSSAIHSIDSLAFHNLRLLRILNMDSNNLNYINSDLFEDLTNLQELYLSNNKISAIAADAFANTQQLQIIHLHNNQLTTIPLKNFWNLKLLHQLTSFGNYWSCDCKFALSLKEFLVQNLAVVLNGSLMFCNQSGLILEMSSVNENNCARIEVQSDTNVAVWVSVLVVGIVIILTAMVVFLYRYEMQVLFFSKLNVRLFNRYRGVDEVAGKVFDAFVVYSHFDFDFVIENIMPKLEEIENPYTICIQDRNFMGGGTIMGHIEEAIRVSVRSIFVVTDNFLRNGLCRFQFRAAHIQLLEDKCRRLLVIVVGEIPSDIDPEMKVYLRTYTYLKWGDKWFWEKLYYAMSDKRVSRVEPADYGDFPMIPLEMPENI